MMRNLALRLAGSVALATSAYHGILGDSILRGIEMAEDDLAFVTGTYQIGTMGWAAGGVLLIGAAGMDSAQARNWIVGVLAVLYGIPAFGTLALTGGEISLGGVLLSMIVALALFGRPVDSGREAGLQVGAAPNAAAKVEPAPKAKVGSP